MFLFVTQNIHHAIHCWMLRVFNVNPVLLTTAAHLAGGAKQVRPDLTVLERINENAPQPSCQQPFKVCLAHRQRQLAQIVAVECQDIEGAQLQFVVVAIDQRGSSAPLPRSKGNDPSSCSRLG